MHKFFEFFWFFSILCKIHAKLDPESLLDIWPLPQKFEGNKNLTSLLSKMSFCNAQFILKGDGDCDFVASLAQRLVQEIINETVYPARCSEELKAF